jgi:hypothetical protein
VLHGIQSGASDPGWQSVAIGGIDVQRYCADNFKPKTDWLTTLAGVHASSTAFVDGRGAGEAYRWKCSLVLITPMSGDDDLYEASMNAWSPDSGPPPNPNDSAASDVEDYTFDMNMNQACQQQYGQGTWAQVTNPDDMTSWKCFAESLVVAGMSALPGGWAKGLKVWCQPVRSGSPLAGAATAVW